MTVPGAVAVISQLAKQNSALIVGAGTVFDVETAQQCLDAGVAFLTTPGLDLEIVNFAVKHGTVVFPGAMTPGEVMAACGRPGPISSRSSPARSLAARVISGRSKRHSRRSPLIASGGVNQETAIDFIRAGAVALGIGRHLIHPDAIRRREDGWIRELSRRYLSMVKQARNPT